jgi:hypothetical protein
VWCQFFDGLISAMSSSAFLGQVNGSQRPLQASMKRPIAAIRPLTERNMPRRMARRVMMPKKNPPCSAMSS